MKKLKILSLILAFAMCLTLMAGCGKTDDEGEKKADTEKNEVVETKQESETASEKEEETVAVNYGEDFTSKIGKLVDLSKYSDLTEDEFKSPKSKVYCYSIKSENAQTYNFKYSVVPEASTQLTLPISYKDLEAMGWNLRRSKDQEVEPGYGVSSSVSNDSGKIFFVSLYNRTDSVKTVAECEVLGVSFAIQDKNSSGVSTNNVMKFTIDNTITENSTMEEIIDYYGAPSEIEYSVYFNEDGSYNYGEYEISFCNNAVLDKIIFTFSADTGKISNVYYIAN